jgi:hypothetical protein
MVTSTISSTSKYSTSVPISPGTNQASTKAASTQALDSSAVKVQISDKARQAMASPMEKQVRATSNLEKQATKLAERAASKDISDSERQKLGAALQSINGAIKGLGGKQVGIDRNQDSGTTAAKDTTASGATAPKTQPPATTGTATQTKTQTPVRSDALAAAAENTSRKNDAAQAALNNLAKVYGGGSGTTSGRLNLVA